MLIPLANYLEPTTALLLNKSQGVDIHFQHKLVLTASFSVLAIILQYFTTQIKPQVIGDIENTLLAATLPSLQKRLPSM